MTGNLALWERVEKTDPKHVKQITGKQYDGNSPKPHYLVHKATETFGPCGIGWGFVVTSERVEEGSDGDKLHIARVKVWYEWDGKRGEVEHIGATPFSGKRSSGKSVIDEDAAKKSVTDALVKALSMIGFAGDIFMGRYDDSKYVSGLHDEFAHPKPPPTTAPPPPMPNKQKPNWDLIMSSMMSSKDHDTLVKVFDRAKAGFDMAPADLERLGKLFHAATERLDAEADDGA